MTEPTLALAPVEALYFEKALRRGGGSAHGVRSLTLLSSRAGGKAETLSYAELLAQARGAAEGLEASGLVRAGVPFILVGATGLDEVVTFLGALLLGAQPALVSPPVGLVGLEGWVARVVRTAEVLGASAVVGGASTIDFLRTHGVTLPLVDCGRRPRSGRARPEVQPDAAYLQLTSGSTADPKAVVVGHDNATANIDMIGHGSGVTEDDRVASWLPLYHDMGLLGTLLFALRHGLDLVLLPPQAFLTRPVRWLEAISQHRCTLSPAPAFAFPYVAHRAKDEELVGLDLTSWRIAYCGAEPIHGPAVRRFVERLAPRGLRAGTIFPCYGLAEATLAVTFGPPQRGLREVALSRRALGEGRAAPPADEADRLDMVLNGTPLPGLEVQVRGDDGAPLAPGRIGAVWVRGRAVTRGYHRNPAATAAAFGPDGWLDTGDQGALIEAPGVDAGATPAGVNGELVVVGRKKDLIIVRGRNYAPVDLEWAAQGVSGVRAGSVAAFAVSDATEGTEAAVVACEVSEQENDWTRGAIGARVQEAVLAHTGLRLADVVLLPPGTIPKTTSGKVQRGRCRALHLEGKLRPE
jgi:fatty-acyl-CoA synthase